MRAVLALVSTDASGVQVRSLLPIGELCDEVEKRNKLRLLDKFLQLLVQEGSQDPQVHNAMGKILIDANSNPEHFLQVRRPCVSHNVFFESTRDDLESTRDGRDPHRCQLEMKWALVFRDQILSL